MCFLKLFTRFTQIYTNFKKVKEILLTVCFQQFWFSILGRNAVVLLLFLPHLVNFWFLLPLLLYFSHFSFISHAWDCNKKETKGEPTRKIATTLFTMSNLDFYSSSLYAVISWSHTKKEIRAEFCFDCFQFIVQTCTSSWHI